VSTGAYRAAPAIAETKVRRKRTPAMRALGSSCCTVLLLLAVYGVHLLREP
jgi:hypothetical protein